MPKQIRLKHIRKSRRLTQICVGTNELVISWITAKWMSSVSTGCNPRIHWFSLWNWVCEILCENMQCWLIRYGLHHKTEAYRDFKFIAVLQRVIIYWQFPNIQKPTEAIFDFWQKSRQKAETYYYSILTLTTEYTMYTTVWRFSACRTPEWPSIFSCLMPRMYDAKYDDPPFL